MRCSVSFVSFVVKCGKMTPTEAGQASGGFIRSGGLLGLGVVGSRPKLPALKGAREAF